MATRKKTTAKRSAEKKSSAPAPAAKKKAARKAASAKASEAKPAKTAASKAAANGGKSAASKAPKAAPKRKEAAAPEVAAEPKKPKGPSPLERLAEKIVAATTAEAGDFDFTALYLEDCVSYEPRAEPSRGFAGLQEKAKYWGSLQKRTTWKPRNVFCREDTICIEWEAQVELRDGRTIDFQEVAIHRISDGKIREERYYYDPSVFELAIVENGEIIAEPPKPVPPRSAARPVESPGTPPVDPIDL